MNFFFQYEWYNNLYEIKVWWSNWKRECKDNSVILFNEINKIKWNEYCNLISDVKKWKVEKHEHVIIDLLNITIL